MAEPLPTFSESWYRIAGQRISLRPGVNVRRQNFRGERWYVLENPFSNQFYRLRPAAYEFVARLRPDRTVQQAWQECLEKFPNEAPGQEAVIQLLSQLYFANLLQYDLAEDSAQLFERYNKRVQREVKARFLNLMFMRFPLLDPDRFLQKTLPVVGKLISPIGALIWLIVVGFGLKVVAENFVAFRDQTQSVLAPDNLFLLYLGMVIIKTFHEFGHAYFCRKFGGEVHVMGVMLMIFTPAPYMDATSSWSFRSRWKRLLVGGAGMIVEIFFAAIAAFIWVRTPPGTLHNLAYNIMFIASVSTVVFNINPLLRFDGYYMLSDLVDIPNLHQRAAQQLRFFAERYLFGLKKIEAPGNSRREAVWLSIFGVASGIYRVIVFGGVLLVIADRFLLLGIIMAVVCFISWVTVPTVRFIQYLASSPKLERQRPRAIAVSAALAAVIVLFLQFVPFPNSFRAQGLLQAHERMEVLNEAAGFVDKIIATPGAQVKKDQPLVQFRNLELELELASTRAKYDEVQARLRQAMQEATPNLKPLNRLLESTTNQLRKLESDQRSLLVRARQDGIWVAPHVDEFLGRWLQRGSPLGLLINSNAFEFRATVKQEDADALFGRTVPNAEIRLYGQASRSIAVQKWKVIPGEQQNLPSPALGWHGGGEMAVSPQDPQGRKVTEPFFEVVAEVAAPEGRDGALRRPSDASSQGNDRTAQRAVPTTTAACLLDGRSGKIRFALEPEALLPRWIRRLEQMFQKRYQL